MKNCCFEVLILACLLGVGCCLVEVTIPLSGSNIVGDLGDENITIFCELTQDEMEQATIWALMREGQIQTPITIPDPNFDLTGDPLTDNTDFFLNTNLTILKLTEDLNNAVIYCGVPATPEAANFTIRLYTPPTLADLGTVGLAEGDIDSVDLSNTTVAEAFPFPVGDQITWRQNGVVVSSDSRVTYGYPSVMFNAPEGVRRSDAGTYQLSGTNIRPDGSVIGSDTGSFTLDVYFGPLITPGGDRVPVEVGGDVTLVCGTGLDSNPASSIEWRDNNDVVIANGGRYTFDSGPSEVSLTIAGVTADDAGDWRCTITVMADGRTIGTSDRNITLFVVVPAATPTDVIAREVVGTAILVCWQQSSDVGTAGVTRYRIYVEPADIPQPIDTPDNETFFNVTGLLPVTQYTFRVQAVTEYQGITVRSNISDPGVGNTTVSVPAPACDVMPVSANGVITVTWGYTHTGGLEITEVIVQYGIYSSGPIDFQDIPDGNLTDLSQQTLVVSDLIAGRAYVFRVTASNDIGPASVDCPPVMHLVGVPPTPEVVMVEAAGAGGGDVNVSVRIPNALEVIIPLDTVTFTVTAFLVSSGAEVISTDRDVNNYRYGTTIVVEIRGQVLTIGVNYRFAVTVSNRFGSSGTSQPLEMVVDETPTTPTSPTTSPSLTPTIDDGGDDNAAAIAGGVIGAIIGVVLIFLIILLIVYCVMRSKESGSYKVEGGESSGVKIEEVEIDIGNELQENANAEQQKELHYAELETLVKKPPAAAPVSTSMPAEEPVQYAVLQAAQPESTPAEQQEQGEVKPDSGDKSQTSTTLV